MCGIVGIINLNENVVSENILSEMNSFQLHRGPDDGGLEIFNDVGFAHRRLSIIDIKNGRQPMSNEDKTIWLIFNGEIYNFKKLRKKLSKKGHNFRTNSDTETIIHLYEEYGKTCVNHLEGMFAFAIYDRINRTIFLARDRLGQKPLHYYKDNNYFIFSSELQALVKHPNIDRPINQQAVHDYLTLQHIPQPNTIYRNIFKLPPASCLEFNIKKKNMNISKYWGCNYSEKIVISYQDAKYELRKILEKAVTKRLVSDVPIGTFLSGGIDSSIISGLISTLTKKQLKTFTIGFHDSKYDERKYANAVAEKFNTQHNEKIVDPADFSIVSKLVKHYGEPFADASMLPTYLLSKFAREKITVALGGDGADEIFGGYYRYLLHKFTGYLNFVPQKLKKQFLSVINTLFPPATEEKTFVGKIRRISQNMALDQEKRYLDIISKCDESIKNHLYGERMKDFMTQPTENYFESLYNSSTALNPVETAMEADLHSYLPDDILAKIDIASMATSLELRSPFMDHKLVSFAASIPLKYKQGTFSRKKILIDACSDIIPKQVLSRSKMGFGVPIARWLRNEWKNIATETLLDGKSIKAGFFCKKTVENLLNEHQSMEADHSYLIWSLMIFELWYNNPN